MSNDNKIPSNAGKLYILPAITPPPHWQGDRTKLQATMQQPTVDEVPLAGSPSRAPPSTPPASCSS